MGRQCVGCVWLKGEVGLGDACLLFFVVFFSAVQVIALFSHYRRPVYPYVMVSLEICCFKVLLLSCIIHFCFLFGGGGLRERLHLTGLFHVKALSPLSKSIIRTGGCHHSKVVGAYFTCLAEVCTAVEHLHSRCSNVSTETSNSSFNV